MTQLLMQLEMEKYLNFFSNKFHIFIDMKNIFLISICLFLFSCGGSTDEEQEVIDPNDNWGKVTSEPATYFPASDVSTSHLDIVKTYQLLGSSTWGNYGPLEYWVVGSSQSAAAELDKTYCNRRNELNGITNGNINSCINRDYNFVEYARDGNAGLNTRRDQGEKWSGFIITMASKRPSPDEDDYKQVILHEYFHVYQNSHVFSKNRSERESRMQKNPWWGEGGAEYMSQLLFSKQPGITSEYLKERMTWKMDSKAQLKTGEKINQIPYGDRGNIAYDLGSWFVAYLINKTSEETYRTSFYKDLNDLGFEGSFSKHFGSSSSELLVDFHDNFLNLTIEDQLKIIP